MAATRVLELATPNVGTASDVICCPGLDFCLLANATSIPIANGIQQIFDNLTISTTSAIFDSTSRAA